MVTSVAVSSVTDFVFEGADVDRRMFLKSAGSSTAVAATVGLGTARLTAQSSPNPNTYTAAVAAHAIASGNAMYAAPTSNDWYTVQNTLNNCLSEWTSNGRDAGVQSGVGSISPSMVTSSNMDHQAILQTIRLYQPSFQLADVQTALNFIDNNQSLVPGVMNNLQSYGMSYYLRILSNEAGSIGAYLSNGGTSTAAHVRRGMTPDRTFHDPPEGGGGGYNCPTDGALIFAAGIAFATIAVMTMGAGAPLAGAAWVGIAGWGGLGVTGWGIGHAVAGCSF